MPVKNDAGADAGAHRHINQPRLILSGTPSGFAQGGGIPIIFYRYRHAEYLLQVLDWLLPSPMRKETHIADFASERIYRPRGPDSNASKVHPSTGRGRPQHGDRAIKRALVGPVRLGCRFATTQQLAFGIHDPHRNLRSSDIDRADHSPPKSRSLGLVPLTNHDFGQTNSIFELDPS